VIRRFARPYARAIMDVTQTPQVASALLTELRSFEEARRSSSDLQELYSNPGIDIPAKLAITGKIAARLKLTPMAIKVLEILIRNHRANDLDAINAALSMMINKQLGVVVAEVRSAHQLGADEVRDLQSTLERKVGKKVELELTTDPTLLGGFVAKIGSEIWNASVSGKIDKFRASLE
jgi:F-type H+-transporting ATPase subunit delta